MANLSNINNILRTGSLGVGINRDPLGAFEISSATKPGIKMFNTAASGKTYEAYSDTNGNYIIYDQDADDNRFVINSAGNATFSGNVTTPQINLNSAGGGIIDNQTGNIFIQTPASGGWIFRNGAPGYAERMRINSSGNVGIGVVPNAPANGLIQLDIGDNGCGMTSRQNNELILQANANYGTYAQAGVPATRINLTNSGEFHFLNAPAGAAIGDTITFIERMRIDSSGRVGIGVTPSYANVPLHTKNLGGGDSYNIFEGIGNAWVFGEVDQAGTKYCQVGGRYGAHSGINIDTVGNVGIGTNLASAKLEVTGTTTKLLSLTQTRTDTSTSLATMRSFYAFGITQFRGGVTRGLYMSNVTDNLPGIQIVDSSDNAGPLSIQPYGGNVGIGTTNPNGALSVENTGTAGVPVLDIINTSNAQFNHSGEMMTPNMLANQNNIFVIGRQSTTKESGYIGYKWSSSGSNSNVLTFGHWGSDNLMNIDGLGNVGIGTITPRAKLEVVGDTTIQNGVYTYQTGGYTSGATAINVDITVGNEGGGGNVFKIEAGFAHYYAPIYNSIAEWWCTSRGTVVVNTYILNAGTTNSGDWSASKPNTTTLRVTKSAGTYGGGGKWWFKVTYIPF